MVESTGDKPTFFISYSVNKAVFPKKVEAFVKTLKSVIEQDLGARFLDLFDSAQPVGIKNELLASLYACDCLVAETTAAAPNIYVEAGFAEALGKPVVAFLDRDRNSDELNEEEKQMSRMRGRLFGNAQPSDLGDLRYQEYCLQNKDSYEEYELTSLRSQMIKVLSEVRSSMLSSSILVPKRYAELAFRDGLEAIKEHHNHPSKLWLVEGLAYYVRQQYTQLDLPRMHVDESIYPSLLKAMAHSPHRMDSSAIADLEGGIEPFLLKSEPADVKVKERFFVFGNDEPFSQRFDQLAEEMWSHATSYQCYAVDKSHVMAEMRALGLPARTGAVSADMICTADSLAWYSAPSHRENKPGRELLTIDHDAELLRKARTLIGRIRKVAVDLSQLAKLHSNVDDSSQRARLLKANWMSQRKIGRWQKHWRGATARGSAYYNDYEQHIRAWIPEYGRLTSEFVDQSYRCIVKMGHSDPVSIIEVGPGTGEATERLLRRLHRQIVRSGRQHANEYVIYESATDMLERMAVRGVVGQTERGYAEKGFRVSPDEQWHILVRPYNADFLQGLSHRSEGAQPSIVIGSLVHHYVDVLDVETPDMGKLLDEMIDRLPGLQAVVFAGVFFSSDVAAQISEWQRWMGDVSCLDQQDVQTFFKGNPEMQRPFDLSAIKRDAEVRDWQFAFTQTHRTCPFGVLRLTRGRSGGS